MSTKSQRIARAKQRLERERQRARKAESELRAEKRKMDTRRKVLAGAYLLEVVYEHGDDETKRSIADSIGKMLVAQTQKKVNSRRRDLGVFADVFGDDWVCRWSAKLGDDEGGE